MVTGSKREPICPTGALGRDWTKKSVLGVGGGGGTRVCEKEIRSLQIALRVFCKGLRHMYSRTYLRNEIFKGQKSWFTKENFTL